MADKTVFERVAQVVSEQMSVALRDIELETTLSDIDIDSLDQIELVMAIEDEFEIEIPDEVSEKWVTVQHIVDYLTAHAGSVA